MTRWIFLVLCAFSAAANAAPVPLFVSILPQAYLAERVGGIHVSVTVLIPPGQGPHTFEPTPKQLTELATAQSYFTVGLPFETRLIEKLVTIAPNLKIVDCSAEIPRRTMGEEERDIHQSPSAASPDAYGNASAAVGTLDPHVWLNPLNAKIMAGHMAETLRQISPEFSAEFEANLKELTRDLDAVHQRVGHILEPYKGNAFYVYHPAFGYFADAYGLKQISVEIEGKEPTAKDLAALIERAKKDQVRVIFVQRQYSPKAAETIAAAIHGKVIPIDPLAHDYPATLQDIAEKLAGGFTKNGR